RRYRVSSSSPGASRTSGASTRTGPESPATATNATPARASVVAEAKLAYGAPPSGLDCFFVATARSSLSLTPRAPRPLNLRLANHRHEAPTHRPSASVPAKPCRNLVVPTREMSSAKGGGLEPEAEAEKLRFFAGRCCAVWRRSAPFGPQGAKLGSRWAVGP